MSKGTSSVSSWQFSDATPGSWQERSGHVLLPSQAGALLSLVSLWSLKCSPTTRTSDPDPKFPHL